MAGGGCASVRLLIFSHVFATVPVPTTGVMEEKELNMADQSIIDGKIMGVARKGRPILLGEYRLAKAEEISFNNKKTNAVEKAQIIRWTIEGEDESFPVTEWLPRGSDIHAWKSPFSKGQLVLVTITGFFREKGQTTVRGTVERV